MQIHADYEDDLFQCFSSAAQFCLLGEMITSFKRHIHISAVISSRPSALHMEWPL